jgi:SAM-dependent methyltransferase
VPPVEELNLSRIDRLTKRILRRLKETHGQRGTYGTIKHLLGDAPRLIRRYNPLHRVKAGSSRDPFDVEHNVDTFGDIDLALLDIHAANYLTGKRYQPVPPVALKEILSGLAIDYDRFTFVDLGSGKGRALLVASEFPFKKIVGVEFARDLHDIAQDNILRFKNKAQRCMSLVSISADALEYTIPCEPLVVYSYNAFEEQVLLTVVERIRTCLERSPREAYLILHNFPELTNNLSRDGFWNNVKMTGWYTIYSHPTVSPVSCLPKLS